MWGEIQGHDEIADRFRRAMQRDRMASSFLFVGPGGVGKRLFARQLAKGLLCQQHPEPLDFCNACPDCQQVESDAHADYEVVQKPEGKSSIPLELLIGDRQHRMRSGLCYNISLKPMRGGKKIAVIADADFLKVEGANALLKTLEEPPPQSLLILISESEQRQLPTIRSRCQTIRFQPLAADVVEGILLKNNLVDDPADARELAALSGGGIDRALRLLDEDLRSFRGILLQQLAGEDPRANQFRESLLGTVDAAGKDASARRDRLREILAFAGDFFQQLMRVRSGITAAGDEVLLKAIETTNAKATAETAAWMLARTLAAEEHVFANANLTNVAEYWLDDIAETIIYGRLPAGAAVL